jgi:ribose transport system permease protein
MLTRKSVNLGFDRFSAIYLWVAFLVIFGALEPHTFLTMSTLHFVAAQQAIFGIIAIAALVPIVCGQFDLSVGSNANLAGIAAVIAQVDWHWPFIPAILLGIACGVATGLVNGVIVVLFGVNSFIATLGMGSVLSATQVIISSNTQPNVPVASAWSSFTQYTVAGFQIVFLYLIILAVLVWWMLSYTPLGRYMYAVGGNAEAARLSGIPVGRVTLASLVTSGGLAGLGGVLYVSLTGPSLTFGNTLLLPAFAAVFLGSTQLRPGRFNVWGSLIAIYVLATGVEGLQLVSGAEWLGDMFNGVALIVAVALAVRRLRPGRRPRLVRRRSRGPAPADGRGGTQPPGGGPAETSSVVVEAR